MVTPVDGTTFWGKVREVDLQAVGREKGGEREAMLEQRKQVVQEGQGLLVLDLDLE